MMATTDQEKRDYVRQEVANAETIFISKVFGDRDRPSIDEALTLIESQIKWLGYVSEREPTDAEALRLAQAAKKFFIELRRLTAKYVD